MSLDTILFIEDAINDAIAANPAYANLRAEVSIKIDNGKVIIKDGDSNCELW